MTVIIFLSKFPIIVIILQINQKRSVLIEIALQLMNFV